MICKSIKDMVTMHLARISNWAKYVKITQCYILKQTHHCKHIHIFASTVLKLGSTERSFHFKSFFLRLFDDAGHNQSGKLFITLHHVHVYAHIFCLKQASKNQDWLCPTCTLSISALTLSAFPPIGLFLSSSSLASAGQSHPIKLSPQSE